MLMLLISSSEYFPLHRVLKLSTVMSEYTLKNRFHHSLMKAFLDLIGGSIPCKPSLISTSFSNLNKNVYLSYVIFLLFKSIFQVVFFKNILNKNSFSLVYNYTVNLLQCFQRVIQHLYLEYFFRIKLK